MGNNNSNILPPECSANPNVTVQREGMMEKRGDFNTNYKKRWFVLYTNGMMTYRVKPGDSKLRGNVSFCTIKKLEKKTAVTFEVTTAQKVWYFRCQNATDCDGWIQSIRTVASPPATTLTSNTVITTNSTMKSTDSTSLISYIDSGLAAFYYKKGLGLRYVNSDGVGLFAAFCTNNDFDEEAVIDELDPQNKTECQIVEFDPEFPFDGTERDRNIYIFDLLFSLHQQYIGEHPAVQSKEDTITNRANYDSNDDSKKSATPTIDLHLFKLNSMNCGGNGKDVIARCAYLQRLTAARRYFEEWEVRSGTEIAQQQFSDFVAASYPQLTNDYIHFVKCHEADLEEMANAKRSGQHAMRRCDIGKCATLRREHGRRRRVKGRKKQRESVHARYCSSVIDRFHMMMTHLFEMGMRLEKEAMIGVDDDDDEKKEDGDGGNYKMRKSQFATLARRRREFAAAAPDIADDDEMEQHKFTVGGDCQNEMSTGFRFNYWSHNGASDGAANKYDGKARAKHSSLKAEMLSTPNFDADEWEYLMDEARRLHRSERGKALKVTESDHQASYYDLKKGQQISEFHFQCLLAYTNYDDNCYEFRKTLRRNKPSESIESVMSRNSAYFFMSKGLAELVQMFGTNGYDERGPFFTGLSQQFVMRSFYVKFAGATSTSKQLAVALRFAGPAGVLLTLENDTTMSGSSRCFDCSWCSQYAEDERLFMASRRELRLESVILVEAATDFSKYFAALFKFDAMLSGGRIWPLTTSLRDVQIIDKLCMDQLTPSDLAPSNIPEYISQCFSLWCQRKEEVEINIYNLEQFQGLSRMIMDKVVGVDNDGTVKGSDTLEGANILKPRVFGMFGNLKKVDIWTRESGANKKQYPISMDKFLSLICGLDTGVEYMIVANSDFGGTVATWLYQEVNEKTEQMFKEKGWEIEKHLDGLTQWLKLKNVQ